MIVLKCVGGRDRTGTPCTYTISYSNAALPQLKRARKVAKEIGKDALDCPVCRKCGLREYVTS